MNVLMTELHTVKGKTKLMSGNTDKFVQDAITTPTVLEEFKSHHLYNFGIIKIQYIWQNTVLMCIFRLPVADLSHVYGRMRCVCFLYKNHNG